MNTFLQNFLEIRKYSETLCKDLELEDYTPQSAVFASPPKWHLAHTTWFFEEMILKKFIPEYKIFDESFCFLFNSYYNAIGERIGRSERGLITRPSVKTVYEYRAYIDEQISLLLETSYTPEIGELIILGLNHEQQHQELLLTDLKYTLSKNPTHPKFTPSPLVNSYNEELGWAKIEKGIYPIGSPSDSFHFDNEHGQHEVLLESFSISKSLVTNGEYIEFIKSEAYLKAELWLDEGWNWVRENNISSPLYWHKIGNEWYHYTLAGLQKINHKAILSHVSFYEAVAYANYKGYRLPTEFEWEAAADQSEHAQALGLGHAAERSGAGTGES